MIHDPIRPSIEQLFADYKQAEAFAINREYLSHAAIIEHDDERAEKLQSLAVEARDEMEAIRRNILKRLDATFGPGMGEAVKEMIGND